MADDETRMERVEVIPARRALLLEPEFYSLASLSMLRGTGVEPDLHACANKTELLDVLEKANAAGHGYSVIFARLGLAIDAEVIKTAGDSLRFVVTPTTGLGHIDMDEAMRWCVCVLSLKGEFAFLRTITSTAELAWGLLIALVRRIPAAHADVLTHSWRRDPFRGRELQGMTLGIIGLGRLGAMVAVYARAFGMKVLASDKCKKVFENTAIAYVEPRQLDSLLAEADIVSLHLPLEDDTRGIIGAEQIARMKTGAYFVNTARGELVDEEALLNALQDGHLAGCALDVLCGDSRWELGVPEDHPLVAYARLHDNLLLTPHIGGYSIDAIAKTRSFMVERFCEQLETFGRKQ